MIVFPNAKINLGLHVTEKRDDGFHNIESVFFPIGLKDVLEIVPHGKNDLCFSQSGIDLPASSGENLVEKAYHLIRERRALPHLSVHLHKSIPFGAGLGGGSADASFALKAINDFFEIGLSMDELKVLSRQIGADCPFFIENRPALATGIGDVLEPLDFTLKGYFLVLIKPNVSVPTAGAYKHVIPKQPKIHLKEIIRQPVETWKELMVNDFEVSVFKEFPQVEKIKKDLYELGATYASMSGSGSAVFGLFKQPVEIGSKFTDCFFYTEQLK